MARKAVLMSAIGALSLALAGWALGPTFRPDYVFRGSSLNQWHTLGQADWKAAGGEITGNPRNLRTRPV